MSESNWPDCGANGRLAGLWGQQTVYHTVYYVYIKCMECDVLLDYLRLRLNYSVVLDSCSVN